MLVVAGSRELLDAALEQRDADGRLTEDTFEEGLADLPEEALIKVYGDIGALIESDPETEQARKVKWVAALDTFGPHRRRVQEDGIAIDFNLATGRRPERRGPAAGQRQRRPGDRPARGRGRGRRCAT